MAEGPNGGTYTKAYCQNCKRVQPIIKELLSDDVLELVCTVCRSVIATLCKDAKSERPTQ
jgi:hypothetical protein